MSLILVISAGTPPIGSWHQRIKMFNFGFREFGHDFFHIVPYYAPTPEAIASSPNYVKYCLKSRKHKKGRLSKVFTSVYGTFKAVHYLYTLKNVSFVIVPGMNFLQGALVFITSKLIGIPYYAEIADENGYLDKDKLTLADYLAKYNQILYERLILKRADKLFVFSSYLEQKYVMNLGTKVNIIRTVPSMIDLDFFDKDNNHDINDINQSGIEYLDSECIKFVYAGACNRTNGIFFFLDSLVRVVQKKPFDYKVFFFFVYGDVEKVTNYCQFLGISQNVHVFKPVLPHFIPTIYSKADILVLPEHGDIIANAGFPGKTAELLASGKAIIATDFSDLAYYLKNKSNAMISKIGDRVAYERSLFELMENENLRSEIGRNARATAKMYFDCKNAIKKYL